jgi:hypothetical protein
MQIDDLKKSKRSGRGYRRRPAGPQGAIRPFCEKRFESLRYNQKMKFAELVISTTGRNSLVRQQILATR